MDQISLLSLGKPSYCVYYRQAIYKSNVTHPSYISSSLISTLYVLYLSKSIIWYTNKKVLHEEDI